MHPITPVPLALPNQRLSICELPLAHQAPTRLNNLLNLLLGNNCARCFNGRLAPCCVVRPLVVFVLLIVFGVPFGAEYHDFLVDLVGFLDVVQEHVALCVCYWLFVADVSFDVLEEAAGEFRLFLRGGVDLGFGFLEFVDQGGGGLRLLILH